MNEILKCDHSNESYWAVVLIYEFLVIMLHVQCVYKVALTFWVCEWKPKVRPFKWKLHCIEQQFPMILFVMRHKSGHVTFESVEELSWTVNFQRKAIKQYFCVINPCSLFWLCICYQYESYWYKFNMNNALIQHFTSCFSLLIPVHVAVLVQNVWSDTKTYPSIT